MEEQVGRFGFERDVADPFDYQQRQATESDQFILEAVAVVCGGEPVDPLGGGGEGDAVACLAGLDPL